MLDKYKNKYKIASARLKSWDYANSASYFITICTANREHFFGEIIDGKMNLSVLGDILEQEWIKSIEIRPDMNLSLGEYVIMPNHFHAVIFIGENEFNQPKVNEICNDADTTRRDAMHGVSTTRNDINTTNAIRNDADTTRRDADTIRRDAMLGVSTTRNDINTTNAIRNDADTTRRDAMHGVSTTTTNDVNTTEWMNKFGPQSKNLASIMRGFKSAVTTFARKNNILFDWQTRYYDHIIRNETECNLISNYIINNPLNWKEDKFHE